MLTLSGSTAFPADAPRALALDLATGRLSWIPCGHPPPLLIRGNKVVKELGSKVSNAFSSVNANLP